MILFFVSVAYISRFEEAVCREARKHRVEGVICGHIHHAAMQEFTAVELPYLFLWYPDILTAKSVALQGFPEINASSAFQHAVDWYVAP